MNSHLKTLIFDLDGTLLDTMPDLAVAANSALEHMGFPPRTQDEMLVHMGWGGKWLIEHIVPAESTPEQTQKTFQLWRELYIGSDCPLTRPFDGIPETLRTLNRRGIKLGVLSNKYDAGVHMLVERHFPGIFQAIQGDKPPNPRKPDPATLLRMLASLEATPEQAAYIGDLPVDLQLARNAGTYAIGVSWGYAYAAPLPECEVDALITAPADLLSPRICQPLR